MIGDNPLTSLTNYSRFVVEVLNRPITLRSTVVVWSDSPYTGIAEGEVFFSTGIRLRLREELDFDTGRITSYGYEIYRREERLYWYDDFPHPNDPTLASTFPHHKHVPPDIKRNRLPAPEIRFTRPNLEVLLQRLKDFCRLERGGPKTNCSMCLRRGVAQCEDVKKSERSSICHSEARPMQGDRRQIIALGGGGFAVDPDNLAIDRYILAQARASEPRVAFVPTASGDADPYIVRFYAAYLGLPCRPSHLAFFRRTPDLRAYLLAQDVIYVGGGNTKSMLAVWREWGLPELLREAWRSWHCARWHQRRSDLLV